MWINTTFTIEECLIYRHFMVRINQQIPLTLRSTEYRIKYFYDKSILWTMEILDWKFFACAQNVMKNLYDCM